MKFVQTKLKGVMLVEPDVHVDRRGYFLELYHVHKYGEAGLPTHFVQDNFSESVRGTLRGLHYQLKHPQGKLMMVLEGAIYDVAVDIRRGSPTFGQWVGVDLSSMEKKHLYIPPGFAHGFCVVSEKASVMYKCTDVYVPDDERGIIWNDPMLGIPWPIQQPVLSPKDLAYKTLAASTADLPVFNTAKSH